MDKNKEKAIEAATKPMAGINIPRDIVEAIINTYEETMWRPIDEAPRDGTEILTYEKDKWIDISRYVSDDWADGKWYGRTGFIQPDCFRPLPLPPQKKGKENDSEQ